MTLKGKAFIAGAYEHPTRHAVNLPLAQLHAEVAAGALADAGLTMPDVDGYFCAGDVPGWEAPGVGPFSMVEYLGLNLRHLDTSESWGSAYINHVAHAVQAIEAGKCRVALITQAGRPRAERQTPEDSHRSQRQGAPEAPFELPYGPVVTNMYGMCAMRHMHEHGTTAEQLAWIKVAASHHAQHNPHAMLRAADDRIGHAVLRAELSVDTWVVAQAKRMPHELEGVGAHANRQRTQPRRRELQRLHHVQCDLGHALRAAAAGEFLEYHGVQPPPRTKAVHISAAGSSRSRPYRCA